MAKVNLRDYDPVNGTLVLLVNEATPDDEPKVLLGRFLRYRAGASGTEDYFYASQVHELFVPELVGPVRLPVIERVGKGKAHSCIADRIYVGDISIESIFRVDNFVRGLLLPEN